MATGGLKVQLFRGKSYIPVENANITIQSKGEDVPLQKSDKLKTNSSGVTQIVEVDAPPKEYSMNPSDNIPYSFYDIKIEAEGYQSVLIQDVQVFPDQVALQQFNLELTRNTRQTEEIINVPPNTLVGNYPEKIPENPDKPLPPPPSGLVVLPEPVIPQYITVHQGLPNDNTAPNYTIGFSDYIKNCACCEIFSTWSENTIRANVYCILSFALNRIYTEWYRGKGKDFDVTSSTAYDQAFSYGRNIYDNISSIVDELFTTYMKRFNQKQPLFSQYCDGVKVQCPGWLTQWGSKYLGDDGKTPYEILTTFYGEDLELVTAKKVKGIPMSYPGYILTIGSTGSPVSTAQRYLNRISENYPAIPKQAVDGIYGKNTSDIVKMFQGIFNLPKNGDIDYATWYKISDVYVGVTKIAELRTVSTFETRNKIFVPPVNNMLYNFERVPKISYPQDILK